MSFTRVVFTADAKADLHDLASVDPRLVIEAMRVSLAVDQGTLPGKRLEDFAKTGDLSDCFRVYFGATGDDDTHRIVFRDVDGGVVVEAVSVAPRDEDLPYLLAGLRLDRIDSSRTTDAQRKVTRIRKRLFGR